MSILTDVPADFVIIENKKIPVYTDFRNWIKIDGILADKNIAVEKKTAEILHLCFKRLPGNIGQAFRAAAAFYNPFEGEKGHLDSASRRAYSFEYDAPYIYAAFRSEYGIDLQTEYMHWHTFLALMKSLSAESVFSKIVSLRSMDISGLSGKQKSRYIRLKHIYALPGNVMGESEIARGFEGLF